MVQLFLGDSGSPIVHSDTSKLIGVHQGSSCLSAFESPSEGLTRTIIRNDNCPFTSGNSNIQMYNYTVFSAWENVKETLNLE